MSDIAKHIRTIPHYPKEGIMFRDITSLLKDPQHYQQVVDELAQKISHLDFDMIAGVEARGFILGSALAYKMKKSFLPVRKKGKLPGKTISKSYSLEYGEDQLEVHVEDVQAHQKILVVDDLLATGGTILCAIDLLKTLQAEIVGTAFIVDLPELNGSQKLKSHDIKVFTLCEFSGH